LGLPPWEQQRLLLWVPLGLPLWEQKRLLLWEQQRLLLWVPLGLPLWEQQRLEGDVVLEQQWALSGATAVKVADLVVTASDGLGWGVEDMVLVVGALEQQRALSGATAVEVAALVVTSKGVRLSEVWIALVVKKKL
jgi:hypothetical protein